MNGAIEAVIALSYVIEAAARAGVAVDRALASIQAMRARGVTVITPERAQEIAGLLDKSDEEFEAELARRRAESPPG